MKNIFKLMGLALLSCSLMVACGDKDNDNEPTGGDPTWTVTFDGTALDCAQNAGCAYAVSNNVTTWMVAFAKTVQGNQVSFPYAVGMMSGAEKNGMENRGAELYKDTYYTAGSNQYGDWQNHEATSINISALDMTSHTMSGTMVNRMYSLTEVLQATSDLDENISDEEYNRIFDEAIEASSKANLSIQFANIAFEQYQ